MNLIRDPTPRTLARQLLIHEVRVRQVSLVKERHRSNVQSKFRRSRLAIARPNPKEAIRTERLRRVRERLEVLPVTSPAVRRGTRRLFIDVRVINVQFALVPSRSLSEVLLRERSAALMRVA